MLCTKVVVNVMVTMYFITYELYDHNMNILPVMFVSSSMRTRYVIVKSIICNCDPRLCQNHVLPIKKSLLDLNCCLLISSRSSLIIKTYLLNYDLPLMLVSSSWKRLKKFCTVHSSRTRTLYILHIFSPTKGKNKIN